MFRNKKLKKRSIWKNFKIFSLICVATCRHSELYNNSIGSVVSKSCNVNIWAPFRYNWLSNHELIFYIYLAGPYNFLLLYLCPHNLLQSILNHFLVELIDFVLVPLRGITRLFFQLNLTREHILPQFLKKNDFCLICEIFTIKFKIFHTIRVNSHSLRYFSIF